MKAWKNKEIVEDNNFLLKKKFLFQIKAESIDKSVLEMERSKAMTVLDCKWTDIGSWDTISELEDFKNFQNETIIEIESQNNFSFTERKNVIFLGVNNLILVDHKNTILVLKKGKSQKLKKVIDFIKNN